MSRKTVRLFVVVAALVLFATPAGAKVLPYDVSVDATDVDSGDTVTVTVTFDPDNVLPPTMTGVVFVEPTGEDVPVTQQPDGTYRGTFVARDPGALRVVGTEIARSRPISITVPDPPPAPVAADDDSTSWPWVLTAFVVVVVGGFFAAMIGALRAARRRSPAAPQSA